MIDRVATRTRFGGLCGAGVRCCAWIVAVFVCGALVPSGVARAQSSLQDAFSGALDTLKTVNQTVSQPTAVTPPQNGSNGDEPLPPPRLQGKLGLADEGQGDVQLSQNGDGRITLMVRDAALSRVLAVLAQTHKLNIVASNDIDAIISITLRDVPLEEALSAILSVANYTWVERNNIIMITSITDATKLPADVQGRQIQVFDLDFASAPIVAESVTNFLSPIGKVTIAESSSTDNRQTQERLIVEDLPESLARIAAFICQVDRAPRQVLIEAHVLQVTLDDTCRCGVNLNQLIRISGADLTLETTGFAAANAPQAFLATLEGGDLGGVIEALQRTTDSKTLGSPKLLVLNEQEAEFQVGEKLGYRNTTTTETSTLQRVQFLDVGVVLTVTPRITREGRILMHVAPKVSSGIVTNDLPSEKTTELHTDVILEDGQGMIIGGLIKEEDTIDQQKVPYLGDVKTIGWLFRRTESKKARAEIIIALVPRIQPYDAEYQAFEQGELVRAGVPLFHGALHRTDRPWDPLLPNGKRGYYPLIPKKKRYRPPGYYDNLGKQYVLPPNPLPKQQFYDEGCEVSQPCESCEECESCNSGGDWDGTLSEEMLPTPRLSPPVRGGEVIYNEN